ncbi:MAG: SRPBCC domain-containing protein [Saprospiraceae bacterium]|nr:SRPBCC domain-containing protein [Saprospiraceae bacterium]
MASKPITVRTSISAPITETWDCFTQETHITNWNFATEDWCCPSAENDLRPEGSFKWRMEAKDGSMGFDLTGTYQDISSLQEITYQLENKRKVSVLFEESNGNTIVTQIFEPEAQNSRELQEAGWQAILNNFKKYVENL